MNKQEAIQLLEQGYTLTHRNFDFLEWIKQDNDHYVFEDGVKCPITEFWRWRTLPSWENDWEIYKCNCNVNLTNVFHKGNCIKCHRPIVS